MAGTKGEKKRFWSDDKKRSIGAQMTVAGVSVAQVARRYAVNANLIHNWLKDPRFAPEPEIAEPDCLGGFLPVEIEGMVAVPLVEDAREMDWAVSAQRVDITLSDDQRILIEGSAALSGGMAKEHACSPSVLRRANMCGLLHPMGKLQSVRRNYPCFWKGLTGGHRNAFGGP